MAETQHTSEAAETVAAEAAAAVIDQTAPARAKANVTKELPSFTRSLLRVKVPVMVTLATKKQSLGQIVELGPGSIINFDKSCDEMLELEASGRRVALGEAVKIGDKFGLRVVSITLPDERFRSLRSPS